MKRSIQGFILASLVVSQSAFTCTKDGTEGFLPKNDLWISTDAKEISTITETEFHSVIDRIEKMYAPIVAQYGGDLKVVRKWNDGTVNAYAEQEGKVWKVSMFGGLARHRTITPDGFALVVCHELGHHIGGAPKYVSDAWASNEGQSDYFATMKCLRRVWEQDDNEAIVAKMTVPKFLESSCAKAWSTSADRALCIRNGMAGDSVAKLFASLSWGRAPKFDTPDTSVVSSTNDNHPATQCRLDTYFQGSLCDMSFLEDVSQEDEVTGTCHGSNGHSTGMRPLCWFKPSVK